MFNTDDEMYASKAVSVLPPQYQLEALGLWLKCGQWAAHQTTEGYVPLDKIRELSPLGTRRTNTLIALLVDESKLWTVEPWRGRESVLFDDWDVWQETADTVKARRDGWKEAKRRQRAANKQALTNGSNSDETRTKVGRNSNESHPKLGSNSDQTSPIRDDEQEQQSNVLVDVHPPVHPIVQPPLVQVPLQQDVSPEQQANVSNERAANVIARNRDFTAMVGGRRPEPPPPDPGPNGPIATRLVDAIVSERFPASIRGQLIHQATRLLDTGTAADDVEAGLRIWLTKPHLGPPALASCVAEGIKIRAAGANGPPRTGGASAKAQSQLAAAASLIASRNRTDPRPEIEAP